MTDHLPSKERDITEAATIARDMIQYAYQHGMHEVGFDPVRVLMDEIARLETHIIERQPLKVTEIQVESPGWCPSCTQPYERCRCNDMHITTTGSTQPPGDGQQ